MNKNYRLTVNFNRGSFQVDIVPSKRHAGGWSLIDREGNYLLHRKTIDEAVIAALHLLPED